MQFMVAVASRGLVVAKPYGDNEKYDLIVDAGRRLWRVQVKSSAAKHHRGYAVRASWSRNGFEKYRGAWELLSGTKVMGRRGRRRVKSRVGREIR
jgi:hypothetical protein